MALRRLKFTNTYSDQTIVVEETIDVPDVPGEYEGFVYDDYDDFLHDLLFEYTGTGTHLNEDAWYECESIDGLEPKINLEWG